MIFSRGGVGIHSIASSIADTKKEDWNTATLICDSNFTFVSLGFNIFNKHCECAPNEIIMVS